MLAFVPSRSDDCHHRSISPVRRLQMKTFTIENDTNNITLHASGKGAEMVPDSERFSDGGALAKLAANWPRRGWWTSGTACLAPRR
jgi:hypothetical protein